MKQEEIICEICGICTQDFENKTRCNLHINDIFCGLHRESEPVNRFTGKCKWCYNNINPSDLKEINKRFDEHCN